MDAKSRAVKVNIGGEEYDLLFTAGAMIAVTKKYGDVNMLLDVLSDSEHMDKLLEALIYVIVLFANQAIALSNLTRRDIPKELISEEYVSLNLSVYDTPYYQQAVIEAITKGSERYVREEGDESKNPTGE